MLIHHLADRGCFGADTWFGQLDARLKIIFALLALMINLYRNSFLTCGFFSLLAIVFFLSARGSCRNLAVRMIPPAGIAAMVALIQGVVVRGTAMYSLSFPYGPVLTISREGLIQGALRASLILSGALLILILVLTTPMHQMISSLAWFRVPALFIDIFLFVFRYLFLLAEEANRIYEAQRVRLGYSGWRRSLSSLQTLGGMIFLRAFDRAENVYQSMQTRGYSGQKIAVMVNPLTGRDYLFLFMLLSLNLAGFII
ncbi:MAG: cobalt ECF transporter T component CbiQ [bacterium]